jgi:hypothetical protein
MQTLAWKADIVLIVSRYSEIFSCGKVSENFGDRSGSSDIDKARVSLSRKNLVFHMIQ